MMNEKEAEQIALSERVILKDSIDGVKRVAGVDSAYFGDKVVSGVVVMEYGQVVEESYSIKSVAFPYKPTFLAYTEGPSMVEAVTKLNEKPELLFVDGHGIAHPRRAGLACYVGVLTDIPTIGVAKNFLVGEYQNPRYEKKGEPLMSKKKQIGWVVKPRATMNPVFISPGNRVSIKSSLDLTLKFMREKKQPEPLALAHEYANKVKKHEEEELKKKKDGLP